MMKSPTFAALVLIASMAQIASGQVKSVAVANNHSVSKSTSPSHSPANSSRVRVLGKDQKAFLGGGNSPTATTPAYSKSDPNNHSAIRSATASLAGVLDRTSPNGTTYAKVGGSSMKAVAFPNTTALPANLFSTTAAIATRSSQIYRVGPRDVLDIQLSDNPSKNSTLFTVLDDGVLEYPLAGSAIVVGGLTTPEIAALLRQRIKVFDNPTVAVTVREYSSHSVTVTGFVEAPGTKIMRREAVPLYTLLAEASILPEAARATITRQGQAPIIVDLKDSSLSSTLVVPGDAIKVSGLPPGPTEFFFIGGQISSPGQKPYHSGLTLTQAILASGGKSTSAGSRVRVSRQGADGRLSTEEYNLRKIQAGKTPDPILQKGDRIEVTNSN